MVTTAKRDGSVKLEMDAEPMNTQIFKNQYQRPQSINLLEKLDVVAQTINSNIPGEILFNSEILNMILVSSN